MPEWYCKPSILVSIHAPTRGATYGKGTGRRRFGFQSTPLREGRQSDLCSLSGLVMFQSTPLREGRRYFGKMRFGGVEFQSTPLREGRRSVRYDWYK